MKKIILFIATTFSITTLISSIYFKSSYNNFNEDKVITNIDYLSSDELQGRLPGSEENETIALQIEALFQNLGLSPIDGSYKDGYVVKSPVFINGTPTLTLTQGENHIKDFTLGKEFKEDMLNFKDNSISFTKNDPYEIYKNGFAFFRDDKTYFFNITSDNDFSFRSSFYANGPYSFVITINTDTFNELLDGIRSGYSINITLPYEVQDKTVYNVYGVIEGSNKDLPPLVFTAHFDHLGVDSLGNLYSGALDNGSGTAFLLELATTLSSRTQPERDIVFVALNAEEFGLLGSQNFGEKHLDYIKDGEVINFDMVGCENYPITYMNGVSFMDKDSPLLTKLEDISSRKNLATNKTFQDSSDHASFNNLGINSVTITHANMNFIHTPKDTSEKISTKGIKEVYTLVEAYSLDNCYSTIMLIFYSSTTIIVFSILSIVTLGALIVTIRKEKEKE